MVAHIHPVPLDWGRVLIEEGLATGAMRGQSRDYWPTTNPNQGRSDARALTSEATADGPGSFFSEEHR